MNYHKKSKEAGVPKIPRVMSTQHPDNVRLPFFAESPDMSGEDKMKVEGRFNMKSGAY